MFVLPALAWRRKQSPERATPRMGRMAKSMPMALMWGVMLRGVYLWPGAPPRTQEQAEGRDRSPSNCRGTAQQVSPCHVRVDPAMPRWGNMVWIQRAAQGRQELGQSCWSRGISSMHNEREIPSLGSQDMRAKNPERLCLARVSQNSCARRRREEGTATSTAMSAIRKMSPRRPQRRRRPAAG